MRRITIQTIIMRIVETISLSSLRQKLCVLTLFVAICVIFSGCQDYVRGVPPPPDLIADRDLAQESQLPLLYTSIGGNFSNAVRRMIPLTATLSDEFQSANGISTYTTRGDIFNLDDGNPSRQLVSGSGNSWGQFAATRFLSQDILNKESLIRFTQDSNRKRLVFTGHFFRATTEHYLASYFGAGPRLGGATLSASPFIPTSALHDSALKKYAIALQNAPTAYEARLVNSFVARIHLLEGRFPQALQAATNGLRQGDPPFAATYTAAARNIWGDFADVANAGPDFTRNSVIPNPRFRAYVVAEPAEAGRIPLAVGRFPATGRTEPYFVQAKFVDTSPIELMTRQENALMLAELRLRLSNDVQGALEEVNRVRADVPLVGNMPRLAPRTTTNLDSVYIERDKQLFGTGIRLLDQRRLNRWHFTGARAATAWHFIPIPQDEYDSNPNLRTP
jgi:hypothetical protein